MFKDWPLVTSTRFVDKGYVSLPPSSTIAADFSLSQDDPSQLALSAAPPVSPETPTGFGPGRVFTYIGKE